MARVSALDYSDLPDPIVDLLTQFSNENKDFTNQIGVLAHSPASCEHLYGLVKDIKNTGDLPQRVIEIAVVTASLVNACQYCVGHHGVALVEGGLSARTVDTMLDDNPVGLDQRDIVVRDYARLVTERAWGIRDQVFVDLKQHFSDAQIVTLTVRIGLCILFNKVNQALQIDMEESVTQSITASGIDVGQSETHTNSQ